jgi:propionyl-CoA carboxylase alpha chain
VHSLAASVAAQADRRDATAVLPTLPSGWRNVPSGYQEAVFTVDGDEVDVRYRLSRRGLDVRVNGEALDGVRLLSASRDLVDLEVAGVRRTCTVRRVGDLSFVDSALGGTTLVEEPRFPEPGSRAAAGSLLAPMPGTVVRIAVQTGDTVTAGATILVLEAMKMEHSVTAPTDGVVTEIGVTVAQQVDLGAVLAVVEEEPT